MGRRKSPNGLTGQEPGDPRPGGRPLDSAVGALAAADLAAKWPTAIQSLDRHGRALRRALCPTHKEVSGRYVGSVAEGWAFACPYGAHTFTVPADPTAPKTAYEAAAAAAWAKANPRR